MELHRNSKKSTMKWDVTKLEEELKAVHEVPKGDVSRAPLPSPQTMQNCKGGHERSQ